MLKNTIIKWINEKDHLPTNIQDAFITFCKETKVEVSRSHFFNMYSNHTRIQKIKTGGVYTRSNELINVIVSRSFYGVHMHNTIAIDEKPIIISKFKQANVRISKTNFGKISSQKVPSFYLMIVNLQF